MIADTNCTELNTDNYLDEMDEIVEIEYIGEQDTIDINVSGNRLFYANDILTHNSAVEEVEFDHSHISGGISKINTADNVFGIFTSRSMRERGQYQIQLMKTRSSSGVGQKIDLQFDVDTLKIFDDGSNGDDRAPVSSASSLLNKIKTSSQLVDPSTGEVTENVDSAKKVVANVQSSKLNALLNQIKTKQ